MSDTTTKAKKKSMVQDLSYDKVKLDKFGIPISRQFLTGLPTLDHHLRGGLFGGSFVTVTGQSGTGKSTFAIQVGVNIAESQGKKVLYVDVEGGIKKFHAKKHPWIFTEDDETRPIELLPLQEWRYMENLMDQLIKKIRTGNYGVVVIDTIKYVASLNQLGHFEKAKGGRSFEGSATAAAWTDFYRLMNAALAGEDTIFLMLNHLNEMVGDSQYATDNNSGSFKIGKYITASLPGGKCHREMAQLILCMTKLEKEGDARRQNFITLKDRQNGSNRELFSIMRATRQGILRYDPFLEVPHIGVRTGVLTNKAGGYPNGVSVRFWDGIPIGKNEKEIYDWLENEATEEQKQRLMADIYSVINNMTDIEEEEDFEEDYDDADETEYGEDHIDLS